MARLDRLFGSGLRFELVGRSREGNRDGSGESCGESNEETSDESTGESSSGNGEGTRSIIFQTTNHERTLQDRGRKHAKPDEEEPDTVSRRGPWECGSMSNRTRNSRNCENRVEPQRQNLSMSQGPRGFMALRGMSAASAINRHNTSSTAYRTNTSNSILSNRHDAYSTGSYTAAGEELSDAELQAAINEFAGGKYRNKEEEAIQRKQGIPTYEEACRMEIYQAPMGRR
ncbi:hypothetical protein PAAG_08425 [Paracoccidioides lutzii Pb01]|uniref:Uncharacterized protein n=1 Tax=Paracoccidioides lutzii (strain ATCC MYA-826 / Pb01) TaxID=502779 RepID=C1HCD4_PARBA|nr:hypothetical protein PAAG_08425 [Paracoccidioides lutzii Pb01]EEH38698.2 hypothetical protein PAAG_08425 [Paracoccidioides lutzii Pb01]